MLAVETIDLLRIYKSRKANPTLALDRISLSIEEGEVFGLLGPNGAGKTTLIKILSTVLLPTSGSASILGLDVVRHTRAVRQKIGIVFGGDRGLYLRLTARENLEYWAALYDVPRRDVAERVDGLLNRVGLRERADSLAETYSRGMKQRLHLARGLIANPPLLFLDEPTTGLDPVAAREFRKLVLELKAEGHTILLTTHDMAEAEAICDRVALIDRGRILATETPRTLAMLISEQERIDFDGGPADLAQQLLALTGVEAVRPRVEGGYRIQVANDIGLRNALELLVASGITTLATSRPTLEEIYIHVIGDRGLKV